MSLPESLRAAAVDRIRKALGGDSARLDSDLAVAAAQVKLCIHSRPVYVILARLSRAISYKVALSQ